MPEPVDAPDIVGEDTIWRRVDRAMLDRNSDGTESLQSWAYKDQNHELSVYLSRETTQSVVLASGKPNRVIVAAKARVFRDLGYKIVRDPEFDNPAHCLIHPYPLKGAHRKAMASASRRIPDP